LNYTRAEVAVSEGYSFRSAFHTRG